MGDPLALAIDTLRSLRAELIADGIVHAAVFGSIARGEAGRDSDLDVLIEFAPDRLPDLFAYIACRERIADRLSAITGLRVDVVEKGSLAESLKDAVGTDAVAAF